MARVNLKVSVSGVRGTVGDSLTPSLVSDFAAAFGEYVGGGRVIVGRDTRPSGLLFERAVIAGLLSVGCQPVTIGVAPTPTVQIAVDEYKANGGVVITASHNCIEWNALKFIGRSGIFLNHSEAAELLNIYNQSDRNYVPEEDLRNIRSLKDVFDIHKERIFRKIDAEKIRSAKFRVAIDCCNGAGAPYAKTFLEELGCETVMLFAEMDGVFRRKPEPVPENLTALREAVVKNGCDIGFAQDPDADRIGIVDSGGSALSEQYPLVLAVEHVLSKTSGPVVVNIQTSKAAGDVAAKYNCPLHLTAVGEINVTTKMLQTGAVIGGEGGSGGIIYPAVHPCRDSFTGMALILEMMAERAQSLTAILKDIPRYYSATAKVPCPMAKAVEIIRALKEKYSGENPVAIDGLRIDRDDAWILVRASNTEPVVRIFAEAADKEKALRLIDEFKEQIKNAS
jgi:phosphomannomutase